jgi:hypothetical protein
MPPPAKLTLPVRGEKLYNITQNAKTAKHLEYFNTNEIYEIN